MRKRIYILCVLLLLSTSFSAQKNTQSNKDSIIKGSEILRDAQKAIGTEKINLNSFFLKTKSVLDAKVGEITDETSVSLPDKVRKVSSFEQPISMTVTHIWSGEKYKAFSEFDLMGSRTVRDITNADFNTGNLKVLEGKIDKDKLEKLKKTGSKDPKDIFYNRIWQEFFPLILIQPFEQNLEFQYVGKAESAKRIANVIDVTSKNGRKFRLLFDSETNYLLMMIESFKSDDGDYEDKYYYSDREIVNNFMIPKKIKVEHKFTPTGKAANISYQNIDIAEFALNPEFKPNTFEIK